MFFGGSPSSLGIDIGTDSVKVVELQKKEDEIVLNNYGEFRVPLSVAGQAAIQSSDFSFSEDRVVKILNKIIREAKIETKEAVVSLPIFSSFFTTVKMPPMKKEEIGEAIRYQANQYIPVPLDEVVLDWDIIEEGSQESKKKTKVLLVAVPKKLIQKFNRVVDASNLRLKSLEVESFAEVRALIPKTEETIAILDIGSRTTSVTIVKDGVIRACDDLDFSSYKLTKSLSQGLDISLERAEELKKSGGIREKVGKLVSPTLLPVLDELDFETKKAVDNYLSKNPNDKIQKCIISGATANMPGLKDYFSSKMKFDIEIAQPFSAVKYPSILEEMIEQMGPSFSVAIGLALQQFE